jgi:hypothetical protein
MTALLTISAVALATNTPSSHNIVPPQRQQQQADFVSAAMQSIDEIIPRRPRIESPEGSEDGETRISGAWRRRCVAGWCREQWRF